MEYESPLYDHRFDAMGRLVLRKDWQELLATGRDVREGTDIAEVAELFPPHPLNVVWHEAHKDSLFLPPRAS